MIARHRLLALLDHCDGDEIWSVEHCQRMRVPESWTEELADAYESGFRNDSQTIYVNADNLHGRPTNQYHGVRDVDLALKIAESLGLDADQVARSAISRRSVVQAIKDAIEEG